MAKSNGQALPILIAGGGIGGLAAAYALALKGVPVRVLEQAPEFREIGAGIQLGPNVFRALEKLGLKEQVLADVHLPPAMEMRCALSGERVSGRALIGCDGMWSKVREKVVGDGKPLVSGHIAYRAVLKHDEVPNDLWQPDVILWAGPRTHLVHYPLRRGEIYNLVAVFHSKRYVEGWNAEADAE